MACGTMIGLGSAGLCAVCCTIWNASLNMNIISVTGACVAAQQSSIRLLAMMNFIKSSLINKRPIFERLQIKNSYAT
jgi:hypothetical protein